MRPTPHEKLRILIADDEEAARFGMAKALRRDVYELIEAEDGRAAVARIRERRPHLVFLDLSMPRMDGLGVLRELQRGECTSEIVVVTATDELRTAVECMRLGASDYLTKPFEVEKLRALARRSAHRVSLEERVQELENHLETQHGCGALVGSSRPMQALYRQMEKAAGAPIDVSIRGETGTGKELVAREIHRLSSRADGPFVAVNTAAIAESLAESELFGHVRGAFTGADVERVGLFLEAQGGTLFLDEVGDMPRSSQTKILRALQERTIQPVGSSRYVTVDVRVITATHQDLSRAVEEGHFREDLYYRIRGIELEVPPLRDRREDIPLLVDHFLDRLEAKAATPAPRMSAMATQRLFEYHWPGNVRELEQVVMSTAAMASDEEIGPEDLNLPSRRRRGGAPGFAEVLGLPLTEAKSRLVEAFERAAIEDALRAQGGNISAAARQLGIHRQSLQQKMTQLRLSRGAETTAAAQRRRSGRPSGMRAE